MLFYEPTSSVEEELSRYFQRSDEILHDLLEESCSCFDDAEIEPFSIGPVPRQTSSTARCHRGGKSRTHKSDGAIPSQLAVFYAEQLRIEGARNPYPEDDAITSASSSSSSGSSSPMISDATQQFLLLSSAPTATATAASIYKPVALRATDIVKQQRRMRKTQ